MSQSSPQFNTVNKTKRKGASLGLLLFLTQRGILQKTLLYLSVIVDSEFHMKAITKSAFYHLNVTTLRGQKNSSMPLLLAENPSATFSSRPSSNNCKSYKIKKKIFSFFFFHFRCLSTIIWFYPLCFHLCIFFCFAVVKHVNYYALCMKCSLL